MFNKVPNQWSDAMVIRNRSNKLAEPPCCKQCQASNHASDAHEHKAEMAHINQENQTDH
jgi:hypothetical protein